MAAFVFFDAFMEDLAEGVHDFSSDTLHWGLTNTAPTVATDDEWADITEISAGNGYSAGGQAVDNVTSSQTSGTYSLNFDDEVFTASGGAIAQFRYSVLYNQTATNDELIGYVDKGSAIDLADTESCTIDITTACIQWTTAA